MIKTNLFYVFLVLSVLLSSCSGDEMEDIGTCIDGIKNGTETEIDCGGSCEACASCDDGIKNGTETGVDCGGSCDLCGVPSSGFYFYGIIDGSEVIVSGTNGVGYGLCGNFHINGGSWLPDPFNFDLRDASVELVKQFPGTSMGAIPDVDDLYQMYDLGVYPFGSNCEMEGAEILWLDESGDEWTSRGDQTGSSFRITERGEISSSIPETTTVKGEFTCKLYNGNEVKTIESGKFFILLGLF